MEIAEVQSVMRNELNMSFRKVRRISDHTNSVKSLILRQQCA